MRLIQAFTCGVFFFFPASLEKGAVAFCGSEERDLAKWSRFCVVFLG